MKKVFLYSMLLLAGLVLSQYLGEWLSQYSLPLRALTMFCLSYIMINVGMEFHLDKSNISGIAKDYWVAATAAAFPWIFCALYFVYIVAPEGSSSTWQTWKEALVSSRFAAPTSAGILFTMLIASGLAATWMFRKARILAIFDDLDTVLLMIPLKIMMVGLQWQLGIVLLYVVLFLWIGWRFLHSWRISANSTHLLLYSTLIVMVSEVIYAYSKSIDPDVPIHIEVLLPAFILGCVIKPPNSHDAHESHHQDEGIISPTISALFMLLVGLSMPLINWQNGFDFTLLRDVILVTLLINLGKMFPLFCYKNEAHWKERLAVCIGMFPRGEVGAGILVLSLSYSISERMITVAMLVLTLNLLATGLFITIAKKLIASAEAEKTGNPS